MDFRTSPGVEQLLAVAADAAPQVQGLRDDYLAHIGDAARRTADAIVTLVAAPAGGDQASASPVITVPAELVRRIARPMTPVGVREVPVPGRFEAQVLQD